MYFIDYHSHTCLSPDSDTPLTEMAGAAVAAGLRELCVTDHYDLQGERGGRNGPYDWTPALAQFRDALPRYAGRLELRLGLELGGAPVDPDYCAALLNQPALDFVIGSLHNMSPQGGGVDFYFLDYSSEAGCYAALDDYFASMEALVARPDLFDVLGHIIYPLRYMLPTITLSRYWDRLRELLRRVVEAGRGMEVNTYRGKSIEEWRDLLTLYRSLGGELVTVGADAHIPQSVGKGIPQAYELLRETGFRYITVYQGRKPQMIPLN